MGDPENPIPPEEHKEKENTAVYLGAWVRHMSMTYIPGVRRELHGLPAERQQRATKALDELEKYIEMVRELITYPDRIKEIDQKFSKGGYPTEQYQFIENYLKDKGYNPDG